MILFNENSSAKFIAKLIAKVDFPIECLAATTVNSELWSPSVNSS